MRVYDNLHGYHDVPDILPANPITIVPRRETRNTYDLIGDTPDYTSLSAIIADTEAENMVSEPATVESVKRGRGRPPGSKNKPK